MSSGKPSVSLILKGRVRYANVASLVLLAFAGVRPDGKQCCHYDDDQTNNNLPNLRWGTIRDNADDAIRNRSKCHGEEHPKSKMTSGKVRMARAMYESELYAQIELARIFKISHPAMRAILLRKWWKHV